MKIVVAGLHYSITAALEYVVRALKRRPDVEVKTVGPYAGVNMPYAGGIVVPDSYDFKPDIILPSVQSFPTMMVENMLGDFKPDIWLDVNAGFWLNGKPKNGIRATFLTDPHVIRWLYDQSEGEYDKIFCSQEFYRKPNEIYIPYGFDPIWHSPIEPAPEKEYAVTCIGNTYEPRVKLFGRLAAQGIPTCFRLGVAKEDARLLYNQSVMGINWSSLQDMTARVFETMGLGIVPLLNRVPDLPRFFEEDKHYLGFSDENEAMQKIKWVLDNPDNKIAENARKEVENKHSWDNRVEQMLSHLT